MQLHRCSIICNAVRLLLSDATSTIHTRRSGIPRQDCVGGLQILVDLQGAFDKAPRALLRDALLDLPLPQPVLSLLLSWHQSTPYHIQHAGKDFEIDANIGVRQGCVAAPLLWVAFMRFWHKHLVRVFGMKWLCSHVVTYADDNHFSWVIHSIQDAHEAMHEARILLESFSSYGMYLNKDKTVCILRVKGLCAKDFRKRYAFKGKSGTVLRFPRYHPDHKDLELPLVTQHVYLGVVVSYGHVSQQSFRYRRKCAQQNFLCLRSWWAPSRLSLRARLSLWRVCVWPSLTYGLAEVGLEPTVCKDFAVHSMKNLRWIVQNPCHITRETHMQLLTRLGIEHPLLTLCRSTLRHWAKKLSQSSELHSDDILHRRWLCLQDVSSTLLWLGFCILLFTQTSDDTVASDVQVLRKNLPKDSIERAEREYATILAMFISQSSCYPAILDEGFYCDICEQHFSTRRGLKVHISKVHSGKTLEDTADARKTGREHGTDGMPICQRCGVKYSSWDAFDRHLVKGACTGKLTRLASSHWALTTASFSPKISSRTQASIAPMCKNASLIQELRDDWVGALDNRSGLKDMLKHHCAICHQWFEKSWHLTHHGHRQHTSMFETARSKYHVLLMERGIRRITRNCHYCDSTFQTGAEHRCVVVLQTALLLNLAFEGNGQRSRSRGSPDRRRYEAVPGATSIECDGHIRSGRRLRGKQQETKGQSRSCIWQEEGAGERPPLRTSTSQDGVAASSSQPKTRGFHQCPASGQWIYDLHVFRGHWNSQSSAQVGRGLESQTSGQSIERRLTTSTCAISRSDRRAQTEVGASSRRRIRGKRCIAGGNESRSPRLQTLLPIPPVGPATREVGCDRGSSSFIHAGCAHDPQQHSPPVGAECHPQIPCHQTPCGKHAEPSDSILAGSRASYSTGSADICVVGSNLQLHTDAVDWHISSSQYLAAKPTRPRSEEASGAVLDVDLSAQYETGTAVDAVQAQCWLQLPFENHSNICYLNSVVNAVGWILLHTPSLDLWGRFGRLIKSVLEHRSYNLLSEECLQSMVRAWPSITQQHDACEFYGYLLQKLREHEGIQFGTWGARMQYGDAIDDRLVEPLTHPLRLALPEPSPLPIRLHTLLATWAGELGQQGLHDPPPPFISLQVLRYKVVGNEIEKRLDQLDAESLAAPVPIPVFSGFGIECFPCMYRVQALILHHGATPQEGHYTTLLRGRDGWMRKDDSRISIQPIPSPSISDLCECYLVLLSKSDGA